MSDWAYALSSGLAAGANAGVNILDARMKDDLAAQAEQRAADRQLDTAQRLLAIQDAMKNRAAEHFAAVVKQKMGEEIPIGVAPGDPAPANAADMVRHRTIDEANQAALDETNQTNAPAFIAGTGMLSVANKQDLAEKTLDMRKAQIAERLEASKDRTDMMGQIAQIRLDAARNAGTDGKLPSDAKMIEYLVANGMERKLATDRVTGTGAGATKDPVAMSTSLASSLISSGMVRVTKDDPPGTTLMSKAMAMAMDQITAAEGRFRNDGSAPTANAPTARKPAGAVPNPLSPANDPLGLFKK